MPKNVQREIAADLNYYSLLRPLSELAVARQFAKSDRYDAHFSSCNRNFHILGERPANRWCGVCPKCHFVFLALAPFMPKPRLVRIFVICNADTGFEFGDLRGFYSNILFMARNGFICARNLVCQPGMLVSELVGFRLVNWAIWQVVECPLSNRERR